MLLFSLILLQNQRSAQPTAARGRRQQSRPYLPNAATRAWYRSFATGGPSRSKGDQRLSQDGVRIFLLYLQAAALEEMLVMLPPAPWPDSEEAQGDGTFPRTVREREKPFLIIATPSCRRQNATDRTSRQMTTDLNFIIISRLQRRKFRFIRLRTPFLHTKA